MLSTGSPKNCAPPCCSSTSSERWIEPTEALVTFPYLVVRVSARAAKSSSSACKSLRSMSGRFSSPAILKAMLSTPSWASLRSISRDSSSAPISETVVLIGNPCLPNRSQKITG